MHTLAAFIVGKPAEVESLLTFFQERDDPWIGYWDWWSHGGRWTKALEEEGCEEDENGYYVLPLDKAKEWETPIVVTPFGHVFDSSQMTYEVSNSEAWATVRDSIFDEFTKRKHTKYVAVMVDVHT